MAFITATSNVSSENDKANLTDEKETTFTLSGTVTSNDHPKLSWSSVSGADQYILSRLPVPFFGDKTGSFSFDSDEFTFTDSDVNGAVLGGGIKQVRYSIKALDSSGNLLDTAGPVDYTADSID